MFARDLNGRTYTTLHAHTYTDEYMRAELQRAAADGHAWCFQHRAEKTEGSFCNGLIARLVCRDHSTPHLSSQLALRVVVSPQQVPPDSSDPSWFSVLSL